MVKVTVGEQKPQNEKPFPKLMLGVSGWVKGLIVAFKQPSEGTVLSATSDMFDTADNFYMSDFTDFEGSITLQNA